MPDISSQTFQSLSKHEPFPITDLKDGMFLAREPWMSPKTAFRILQDCRSFRGQIVKRGGYRLFAEISNSTSATRTIKTSTSGSGLSRFSIHTLPSRPVINSIIFDNNAGPGGAGATIYAVIDPAAAFYDTITTRTWTWLIYAQGTTTLIGTLVHDLDLNTWVASVQWPAHPGWIGQSTDEGYISYWVNPDTEIVGLARFRDAGNDYFLACDPDNVYKYDPTAKFYKLQGFAATGFAGPFTGDNSNYFWFWPVDDYIVMTNNIDPVCKWDPSLATADSVIEMPSDWVTPGTNELDTCKLVFQFAGRTVYVNTVENTTRYSGRMRWTDSGTTNFRSASDYQDAPKDLGDAITGQFIGERLFIGFDNGWLEIERTGDEQRALQWRLHTSRFGAVSHLSTIKDSEKLLSRSDTSMQQIDPNGQSYIDLKVPDLLTTFSTRYRDLCASIRFELERSFWWTYVSRQMSRPDGVLCAVYDEENQLSWSQYTMPFNVFSTFDKQDLKTWDQLGGRTMDSYAGQTIDSLGSGSVGTNRVIGGQSDGVIYIFDESVKDYTWNGISRINMVLDSQKLTPFPGQRSHFGWIDILIDSAVSCLLKISFFKDEDENSYTVKTITATPIPGSSKIMRRIKVDKTAFFHRFKIETLDDVPIAFDAFIPWFRPAGRMRQF